MSSEQKTGLALITEAAEYLGLTRFAVRGLLDDHRLEYVLVGTRRRLPWTANYDFSASQNPGSVLEFKISKAGKAAIAEALDRIEAEIAVIRKALTSGRWN